MHSSPRSHPVGLHRRELLQVGYSGLLGLGLPSLFSTQSKASAAERRPKSLLIVFLTGAASHLEMFDPKPDAPAEIRGEFGVIQTKVPGLLVGEHLPKTASLADKYAIVRSMSHQENNHLVATHHVLTGHPQPGAFFDKIASRDDWPCYSAGLRYLQPRVDGLPTGVNLPTFLVEGPLTWPGQHAGILGARYDPWQITKDPNAADFRVDNLRLAPGLDVVQLDNRMALLNQVDRQQAHLAESADGRKLTDQQKRAVSLLTSGGLAQAFDMDREPIAIRERYGRHAFGQSLLLARRLVQAGVRVVQANMGRVQNWDTHGDNFGRMKKSLLPPLDQGVSALLEDLSASGLLEDTLVLMLGEFGRTPKVNKGAGRDHWAPCFSALFAGAGVRPAQVIGKSDKIAAYPITPPYSPNDLGATVYHVLGVDPHSELRDRQNRPVQLNRGEIMHALFTGAVS